ncbi:MAG: 30S ribosomal protein S4 [Tissierellia bacterium]|nr:30S ribosomal protein S4 [Tissierellia bacterium]
MARYLGPKLKRCRSLEIEPSVVGLHKSSQRQPKRSNRKISEYGMQLREKQKAKFIYGVQERQFRKLFSRAERMRGQTGENLLKLLELRFDNIVYRMGFANTRSEARQMVVHGHFLLNGKKADIPSMTLKPGDVIEVKEKSRKNGKFKQIMESHSGLTQSWVSVNLSQYRGEVVEEPSRNAIDFPIEEHLIVELYSK